MHVILSVLASWLLAMPSYAGTLYGSDRYGTSIEVPNGYVAREKPANGDGRTFLSRDGRVRILVYGALDSLNQGLAAPQGLRVTYKAVGRGWAVYSGLKDGKVAYEKMISACKGGGLIHHVVIEYPPSMRAAMSAEVARITGSLKGGCPL